MDQRTCNIIRCCKGSCHIPFPKDGPLERYPETRRSIAAYMSRECATPMEDYDGHLMEQVLKEAMFDYIDTADKPSSDLRNLFCWSSLTDEPTMCQRIMSMFQLVQVFDTKAQEYRNGFTEALIAQSKKDLAAEGDPAWTMKDRHMVPVLEAYRAAQGQEGAGNGSEAEDGR